MTARPSEKFLPKKVFKALFEAKATIALCIALALAFFLLSKNFVFVDRQTVSQFSFSLRSFWNILPYVFVQNSFVHFLANISAILVFGFLLERRIGSRHTVAVFFFSAVLPAIAFSLLNPRNALFGASAIASGLIGASFLLQTKKTIIAAVLLAIVILLVLRPATLQAYSDYKTNISSEISKAETQKAVAVQSGETQRAQELEQKADFLEQSLEALHTQELWAFSTEAANSAHAFGAIVGFAYAYLFVLKKPFPFSKKRL